MDDPISPNDPRVYAALRTILESPMIRKPRQTIAFGILTALLYYSLVVLVLAVLAFVLGLTR